MPTTRNPGALGALTMAVTLIAVMGLLALGGGDALAKKPVPPPPPPDPADVGVIYFRDYNMSTMDTDGTDKTVLEIDRFAGGSMEYRPSQVLHGGERWFLANRITLPSVVDPNGKIRWEVYAVSESGASVLLFSEENMDISQAGSLGWTSHDGVPDVKVSFAGRRFVPGPDSTEEKPTFVVGEYGIYVATIDPDDLPTAGASLELEWTLLPIEFYLKSDIAFRVDYDWSPDGTAFAYTDYYLPGGGIFLAEDDGLGWTTSLLAASGSDVSWSNDGTRLAFTLAMDLCTMNSDGTGIVTVLEDPPDERKFTRHLGGRICWSPNDTHLAYTIWELYTKDNLPAPTRNVDIHRVELTGGGGINDVSLTTDIAGYNVTIGWER